MLERNVRLPPGEIDIVARQGTELVFVEVKTRRSVLHALPEDSLTEERMERLEASVDAYLEARGLTKVPYRIEVVALEVNRRGRVTRCEIIGDVGLR